MKLSALLKQKISHNALIVLTATLAGVFLPWSIKLNGLFTISFVLLSILKVRQLGTYRPGRLEITLLFSSAAYFMLYVISLLYTEDQAQGRYDIEQKWTFLLLPVAACIAARDNNLRRVIFPAFITSVTAAAIICLLISARINYLENARWDYPLLSVNEWLFSYKLLSNNIGLHPAYMALYIALSIIYLTLIIFEKNDLKKKIGVALLITFLTIFLILLSSRTVLVSALLFILAYTMYTTYKNRKFKYSIVIGLMFVATAFVTNMNEITKSRIAALSELHDGKKSTWGTFDTRFKQWEASLEIIRESPLWGIGAGDFENKIVEIYKRNGWDDLANEKFNSHNQFLQSAACIGILGLMCLMAVFITSTIKAISTRDYFYIGFLFIFLSFSLTESTLEVQKGIVFFNLINPILFFSWGKENRSAYPLAK